MKKLIAMILVLVMCIGMAACTNVEAADYVVGVCQLMKHDALDAATKGFQDALTEEMTKAGKTVVIDVQVAGEANLCTTVVNTFVAKNVNLIMANATPALFNTSFSKSALVKFFAIFIIPFCFYHSIR